MSLYSYRLNFPLVALLLLLVILVGLLFRLFGCCNKQGGSEDHA